MKRAVTAAAAFLGMFLATAPAGALGGIVQTTVQGDVLSARISLPGGIGADLSLAFEDATGLTASSAGLSARLIDPLTLIGLLGRLPGSLTTIPAAFPVLLTIEPPASGGLSFEGVATLSLRISHLGFLPTTPLRIFAAQTGGPFVDTTEWMGPGSYRCRSQRGSFSQFLIVADLRDHDDVIEGKFDALDALLDTHHASLGSSLAAELQDLLDAARAAVGSGDYEAAVDGIEAFGEAVAAAGDSIPNRWRAQRDLTNVAGLLRSAAATLAFSLRLEADS
jgi:hypothetical protein